MNRKERRLPRLTAEELANPCTRISLDGVEVQLWQVAHVYGISHDMPSPDLRGGASSQDFRALYSTTTQNDRGIASSSTSTDTRASDVTEQRLLPSLPVLPLNIPTRREAQRSKRRGDGRRGDGRRDHARPDPDTNELLRLIDDFADTSWPTEVQLEEPRIETTEPAATSIGNAPKLKGVIWVDCSFPPPPYPPPNRSLPPLPPQPARNRHSGPQQRLRLTTGPVVAPDTVPATAPRLLPRAVDKSLEYPESDRDDDAGSERTITPRASQKQLVPTARPQPRPQPRPRDVSMPIGQVASKSPVVARPVTTARAASASILRNRGEEIYRPRRQEFGSTETRPKAASPTLPYPLPDLLLNPPSFLQHPPDLSQQPYLNQQPGATARESPQPNKAKSSSNVATPVTSPVAPTSDDDAAVTSRWSSDSEQEAESKLKKLKRALSFSRLRPRKPSLFQKQTGSEANKSMASIGGKHTPGPSGSRRGSKTGN
ncbi:predicted protein [Chaetomium globosum CBS 148.51]|uniref:Uncharacterized protein n=1 Tax=Chaetomium globosum (strain ATCC 6205 / CBS 148.51 / DSM 1962 / NBRC 6347 / NRRL 1970) TaxID=306901 RepID=Q2GR10_CHAGB|nr:uncharacterized protein CHGG_09594 [Chaetomium globosum CBS 148.51]EAQ83190.1 predicted protein [Chaetomium globosum CBS 148.51]